MKTPRYNILILRKETESVSPIHFTEKEALRRIEYMKTNWKRGKPKYDLLPNLTPDTKLAHETLEGMDSLTLFNLVKKLNYSTIIPSRKRF